MLYRKFAKNIEDFLHSEPEKILLVNGARQIGKSFIIRYVGSQLFPNFVEINLREDKEGPQLFANVRTTRTFTSSLESSPVTSWVDLKILWCSLMRFRSIRNFSRC